ncbi:MAG TPA: T9SS type A sorting domain-containing protein [Ignavibacteriaceae bacterium]|nr:T9SS type A sorting domain-containing protein [Ignavibacteriaceae bacterium]
MKNIILITIVFYFTLAFITNGQDILWKKNFGLSTADDYGQSVIEASDGNIVIAGYTGSYGSGGFDVWLIKTTPDGDTLWTRTYGEIGDDLAYEVEQTVDGGFIIVGATESFGSNGMLDGCLIKTDEFGNKEWVKVYGTTHDDFFFSLEITNDGGYILTGERDAYPEGDSDEWIVKTDSAGEFLWEKIYGSNTEDDRTFSIVKATNGGYIIGGSKGCDGYADCDGWLVRINEEGDTLWTKTFFGTDNSDWFEEVVETNDLGYILTGRIALHTSGYAGDVWLLKTDSLGNLEWEKTYDYQEDVDIGYSVQQTIDGGYIIAGGASPPDILERGWIIRTNSVGDTLWTKFIPSYTASPIGSSTICYSVAQAGNGDYIVAGHQTQVTFQQQVMLLRIASDIVPVELTIFTATVTRNSVSLNWQTATETNNSGFEMQRSQMSNVNSQTDWQVIGFVPGFGTTTEPKSYSFIDENLSTGQYQYRLKQMDFDGTFEYSNTVEVEITSPTEFALEQNYPNPFNPNTVIKFSIPEKSFVTLKVYDVLGREVVPWNGINEELETGSFEKTFDASTLSSGVYIYRITVMKDGKILFNESKQMLLIK